MGRTRTVEDGFAMGAREVWRGGCCDAAVRTRRRQSSRRTADDVTRRHFYWLAVDEANSKAGAELRAEIDGQTIRLASDDVPAATVMVNDEMVDLHQPVEIIVGERTAFTGKIPRTIGMMAKSLAERGDPAMLFSGSVDVPLQK